MLATCPGRGALGSFVGLVGASPPPRPPAPPWTPMPLPSMVCFPVLTHPGYLGTPPRPPSGLLCAERWPCELASGPCTEAEAEAWSFRAAPAPVAQPLLGTSSQPLGEKAGRPCPALCAEGPHCRAAGAQPRPFGAHGTSRGWASSPSRRPGPSVELSFSTRISAFFGFPSRLGRQRALRGVP